MRNKTIIIGLMLLTVLLVAACSPINNKYVKNSEFSGLEITVYKSEFCGCCVGYVAELEKYGFDVTTVQTQDLTTIKDEHNIPQNMRSCHTAVVGDYFIEGHVPIEAVIKMLEEKPDIDGITLAGMLSGTPGMPGDKSDSWTIHSIKDGVASEFMTI